MVSKKGWAYYLIWLFLLVPLLEGRASASAWEQYRQTGVTVTGSATWKPYSFVDDAGKPTGFYIDFWNKWSEKTGIPVRFRLTTWSESIEMIKRGEGDIHSGLYFNQERAKYFAFSKPVFYSKGVVIVAAETSCATDMSAMRWGGVAGTEEKNHADMRSRSEVVSFENSLVMFKALVDGKVQAVIDDWSSALMLGKDLGLSESIKICEDVYTRDLHAIVLKENTELLAIVDKGIQLISETEHRVLVNRWYVDHGSEDNWLRLLLPTLGIILAIGVGYFLNKRLRKA